MSVVVAVAWGHFLRLGVVENSRISVGTSMLSLTFPKIDKLFPVLVTILPFPVVAVVAISGHCLSARRPRRENFDADFSTFPVWRSRCYFRLFANIALIWGHLL